MTALFSGTDLERRVNLENDIRHLEDAWKSAVHANESDRAREIDWELQQRKSMLESLEAEQEVLERQALEPKHHLLLCLFADGPGLDEEMLEELVDVVNLAVQRRNCKVVVTRTSPVLSAQELAAVQEGKHVPH